MDHSKHYAALAYATPLALASLLLRKHSRFWQLDAVLFCSVAAFTLRSFNKKELVAHQQHSLKRLQQLQKQEEWEKYRQETKANIRFWTNSQYWH